MIRRAEFHSISSKVGLSNRPRLLRRRCRDGCPAKQWEEIYFPFLKDPTWYGHPADFILRAKIKAAVVAAKLVFP